MGVRDLAYTIYKAAPEAQINQFALPGGPSARGKTFGFFIANFTVLPTGSKQPEAAFAYMRFTAGPQGQLFVQRAPGAWDQACIPSVADDAEPAPGPWPAITGAVARAITGTTPGARPATLLFR